MISVCIPVGPTEANVRWLQDALDSVYEQTMQPDEIILINDGMHKKLPIHHLITKWTPPWPCGVAHSFNFGVALSHSPLTLMMGSDDLLRPMCLEACVNEYVNNKWRDAYYWLDVEYMSTGNPQSIPCNAAAVTKGLWQLTGGIPIEASCGAGDAALLSIMIKHLPKLIHRVSTDQPLYLYRDHEETDTVRRRKWHQVILDVRNLVTEGWESDENSRSLVNCQNA